MNGNGLAPETPARLIQACYYRFSPDVEP